MAEVQIKDLPTSQDLTDLYTIGADFTNKTYKVSLKFIEDLLKKQAMQLSFYTDNGEMRILSNVPLDTSAPISLARFIRNSSHFSNNDITINSKKKGWHIYDPSTINPAYDITPECHLDKIELEGAPDRITNPIDGSFLYLYRVRATFRNQTYTSTFFDFVRRIATRSLNPQGTHIKVYNGSKSIVICSAPDPNTYETSRINLKWAFLYKGVIIPFKFSIINNSGNTNVGLL